MLLDFGSDVSLGVTEASLDAETILGLRLAYVHFVEGKYREGFLDFHYRALKYRDLFTISGVIIAIRQDLKLPEQRPLFLFLHVDEFQKIFEYRWQGTPEGNCPAPPTDAGIRLTGDRTECLMTEGRTTEDRTTEGLCLFREMVRSLGSFMSGAIKPDMIQTFLSGTARKDVTQAMEPTSYSFKLFKCPTLSMGACYDIMGHFTALAGVRPCQWMPKMAFFHLLSATGGLPRALQLLLEELFGRQQEKCNTFKDTVENIGMNADRIFMKVANNLDICYSISAFANTHKELVHALVRLWIFRQPSPRTHVPSDLFPNLNLDVLERDAHMILEDSDDAHRNVLVRIPFFFLHIYNKTIDKVWNRVRSAFLHDWVEDREWAFLEHLIAEYEVVRTNLLIGAGRKTATLGEITKNMDTIEKIREDSLVAHQGIKQARTITVLVTTADITDHALQQLYKSFPDKCLLNYRRNFTTFFGDTFGISATVASPKDLSWNFATRETLKRKHKLGDKVVKQILKNVPYRSYDDLIRKMPAMGSKNLDTEMGFLPYQPAKRSRAE